MKELTVIITFRNEGNEVERTINEIKRTAGSNVEIVLVNDASEDHYDYRILEAKYIGVKYLENQERKGCAASREIGVMACQTPYFLIVDGHMRFYCNNWWGRIVNEIKAYPRAVYCCRCKVWDYVTKKECDVPMPYGAYLHLSSLNDSNVFDVSWITKDIFKGNDPIVDIPCVLGACYAASKKYWIHIRGLEGLRLYSGDEAYLSMKVWMEGGKCRLLRDVAIGHLFRKTFPYKVSNDEFIYNRLFIASTLLPKEVKDEIWRKVRLEIGCIEFAKVKRMLNFDQEKIEQLRMYYLEKLKMDFSRFIKINNWAIKKLQEGESI